MKLFFVTLFSIALLTSCYHDPYLLIDKGEDKYFLSDMIGQLENQGYTSARPIIVIDTIIYRPKVELKNDNLPLSKKQILSLRVIAISQTEKLERYGLSADGGAVLIRTAP